MPLSQEAIRQLDNLGYTSDNEREFYQSIWDSEGASLFWGFLRKEQESRDLCNHWAPRLREYASQCRNSAPLPSVESLSDIERAEYNILCDKIADAHRKEEITARKKNNVVILHSSPVGLLAAHEILGPPSDSVIHLLDAENSHWFSEIYKIDDGAPFWWSIKSVHDIHKFDSDYIAKNYPKSDDLTYWVVTDGCQWGDMAGGANHELWKWDGTNAEAIEVYAVDTY